MRANVRDMGTLPQNDRRTGVLAPAAGTTVLPADFPFFDIEEIFVTRWRTVLGLIIETVLTSGDFTIPGATIGANFSVHLLVASQAGDRYVVFGQAKAMRNEAFLSQFAHPQTLETNFTDMAVKQQEDRRDIGQALRVPYDEAAAPKVPPASARGNKMWVWAPDGLGIRTDFDIADWELVLTALPAILAAREEALDAIQAAVDLYVASYINWHQRTRDWIAAVTDTGTAPTLDRALLMDRTIRGLEAAGFFTWGKGLFLVGETKGMSLVNIVDPALIAAEVGGAAVFLKDRYLKGDGVLHIDTGYTLPQAGFLSNSATLWARSAINVQADANELIGTSGGKSSISPFDDQKHARVRLNSLANLVTARFVANAIADYAVIRRAALPNRVSLYRGDDLFEIFDGDAPQVVAGGGNRIILLGAGAQRATGGFSVAAYGLEASATQYPDAREVVDEHMAEIGAL